MKISTMRVSCKKCGHVFDAEYVTDAPVAVACASMKAIRCLKCGAGVPDVGLGGSYTDAPSPGAGLLERVSWWSTRGERGTSSNTIFSAFVDELPDGRHDYPHDPDDYRRCRHLLDLIPEWRSNLSRVVDSFPYWRPFVERWDEMDRLYDEERPTGTAPRLYALMRIAGVEANRLRKRP